MTYLDAVNRLVPQEAVEKLVSHINGLCLSFDVIPAEHSQPDIHIRQAVSDGLNERVTNDKRVIALVEAAAFSLQISARILEYSIWLHYSEGAKTRLRRCPQV